MDTRRGTRLCFLLVLGTAIFAETSDWPDPGTSKACSVDGCSVEGSLDEQLRRLQAADEAAGDTPEEPAGEEEADPGYDDNCICEFPFEFNGKLYNRCTTDGSKKAGQAWCNCGVDPNCAWTGWDYCSRICKSEGVQRSPEKIIQNYQTDINLMVDGLDCESVYNNTKDLDLFTEAVIGTLTEIAGPKVQWHIVLLKCIDADATKRRRLEELDPLRLSRSPDHRRLAFMPQFEALPEGCKCVFPFDYQGQEYNECTFEGSRKPDKTWCMCGGCSWTGWDYCEKICATNNDMSLTVKAISEDRPAIININKIFSAKSPDLRAHRDSIAAALAAAFTNIPSDTFIVRIKANYALVDILKPAENIPESRIDDGRSWMDKNWEKNVVMFAVSVCAAMLLFIIMCCLVDHCACHAADRSQGLTGVIGAAFKGPVEGEEADEE